MTQTERLQAIENLKYASPLQMPSLLTQIELYDKESSQAIIDDVYRQFDSGEHLSDQVLTPVFLSVLDGLLEGTPFGRSARKKGLTSTRVVNECRGFRYAGNQTIGSNYNPYVESKNARHDEIEYQASGGTIPYKGRVNSDMHQRYERSRYEDKGAMDAYKDKHIKDGQKDLRDEYTGEVLYGNRNDPDKRFNDPTYRKQAQTDHIVPLKEIHDNLKHNIALNDDDIKQIANSEGNFAMTSGKVNQTKSDKNMRDYLKSEKEKGEDGQQFSPGTEQRMLQKEKEAKANIDKKTNERVLKNITGNGKSGMAKGIYANLAGGAVEQSKDNAIGNVILFALKPIYFELSDIFKNGLKEPVGATSTLQALSIRCGRIKSYVSENATNFFGDSIIEFIKGFISSLLEGILNLFVGMIRFFLKLIKEGIKVLAQSAKVLFGKESAAMSAAQKGDAIVKILGGSVTAVLGIAFENMLRNMAIPKTMSVVVATMLSGIAAAMLMYLLNKIDLFSVKAEQRHARIEEIFNERIKDIEETTTLFDEVAFETMRKQRIEFEEISSDLNGCMDNDDIDGINQALYRMADFFKVKLGYSNTQEFCEFMASSEAVTL